MISPRPGRRTTASLFASAIAFAVGTAGAAQAAPVPRPVKVMTRNLYLGADLTPAITATSFAALAAAGTQIWNTVQATEIGRAHV